MWLILAPRIRPDVHVWPGRRVVSAVDALAWPLALAAWIAAIPVETRIVGELGMACCGLSATVRLARAVLANERYRLTTVALMKVFAPLLLVGAFLKLAQIFGAR